MKKIKNLVDSYPITNSSVPMFLVTAADFNKYVARARQSLKTRKKRWKIPIPTKTRISYPW